MAAVASVDDWVKWCKSKEFKDSRPYLEGIRAWRQVWRPEKVRVVLVAESHVGEQPGDLRVRVRRPVGIRKSLPEQYVRLVYCLGYGLDSLCKPCSRPPKPNSGTKQFWDLLGAVAKCDIHAEQPQRSKGARDEERLAWNLDVLNTLKRKRVWLVDASIAALYYPGKKRVKASHKTIHESFRRFVWPMVKGDRPEQVWIIGRGVGKALEGLRLQGMPHKITKDWIISQPNDHDHARYEKDLKRLIRRISVCQS